MLRQKYRVEVQGEAGGRVVYKKIVRQWYLGTVSSTRLETGKTPANEMHRYKV
jgi:hypothetical protein